jgi:hypothetical protein
MECEPYERMYWSCTAFSTKFSARRVSVRAAANVAAA